MFLTLSRKEIKKEAKIIDANLRRTYKKHWLLVPNIVLALAQVPRVSKSEIKDQNISDQIDSR